MARKVRHKVGPTFWGNCWIAGILFLIANFGRIQKVMIRANHVKNHPRDSNKHLMFVMKSGSIAHFGSHNKEHPCYPYFMPIRLEMFKGRYLRKEANYRVILNKRVDKCVNV